MNALELATAIEADLCFDYGEVVNMLRKQNESIQKMREALELIADVVLDLDAGQCRYTAKQALTVTEALK